MRFELRALREKVDRPGQTDKVKKKLLRDYYARCEELRHEVNTLRVHQGLVPATAAGSPEHVEQVGNDLFQYHFGEQFSTSNLAIVERPFLEGKVRRD